MAPKIAWALENKPRIPVVGSTAWNAPAVPNLLSAPLTHGEGRHPFPDFPRLRRYFDGSAGTQAEEVFEDIITQYNGKISSQ